MGITNYKELTAAYGAHRESGCKGEAPCLWCHMTRRRMVPVDWIAKIKAAHRAAAGVA